MNGLGPVASVRAVMQGVVDGLFPHRWPDVWKSVWTKVRIAAVCADAGLAFSEQPSQASAKS
jgi:hypothetical protein